MSSIKNAQRILDAIDQLRRRKARPDKKRICNYVSRRHMVSPLDIYTDLERLVDEQTVIKVEYKGNISYRNAAKWAKLSVHKSRVEIELNALNKAERLKTERDTETEKERMTYAIRGAVSALIVKDKEFLHHGVPFFELEQYLLPRAPDFFARVSLNVLLNRETASGNIVKLANGNYSFRSIAATMRLALSPLPASPAGSEQGTHNGSATKDLRTSDKSPEMDQTNDETSFADSKMYTSPTPSWQDESSKPGLDADEVELDGNAPSAPSSPTPDPGSSSSHLDPVQDNEEHENESETIGVTTTAVQSTADSSNVDGTADAVETSEGSGYRAGERRKRAKKKVFDPSDNNIPKVKKRGRPAGSFKNAPVIDENCNKEKPEPPAVALGPLCALCHAEIKDTKTTSCRDCTKKAHTSCLQKSLKHAAKARSGPWQCSLCKTCQICSQTKEMGNMAVCFSCNEAFHVKCLTPRPKLPLKKWVCQSCSPPEPKSAASTPDSSPLRSRGPPVLLPMLPTALSPMGTDIFADLNDCSIDESIPDASEWTSEEVFEYFVKLFSEHASVFKDQDIDGRSLLLMTRSDVVNGLGLKLGPALKMYVQVKRLQLRRSERHLLWE